MSLGLYDEFDSALYITMSRINHNCIPNAEWSFMKDKSLKREVRALRRMRKDEEIFVSYVNDDVSLYPIMSQRKHILKVKWNFDCTCSLCTVNHEENDSQRIKAQELRDDMGQFLKQGNLINAVSAAVQICELVEKCEDLKSDLGLAYLELYDILISAVDARERYGMDDRLIRRHIEAREEYREKAYELFKKTKLENRKDFYNRTIERLAAVGGTRKLIS